MKDENFLVRGIEHFNAGRFIEAFLQWEEVWLWEEDERRKDFYLALIKTAGALHHLLEQRPASAQRLYHSARSLLSKFAEGYENVNVTHLLEQLQQLLPFFEKPGTAVPVELLPQITFVS